MPKVHFYNCWHYMDAANGRWTIDAKDMTCLTCMKKKIKDMPLTRPVNSPQNLRTYLIRKYNVLSGRWKGLEWPE